MEKIKGNVPFKYLFGVKLIGMKRQVRKYCTGLLILFLALAMVLEFSLVGFEVVLEFWTKRNMVWPKRDIKMNSKLS